MERKINPSTGEFPTRSAQFIYEEYLKTNPSGRSALSANWTSSGPVSSIGGYAGIGRINCIAFHPTDNNTYWVGAASGGLWVTTNNGSAWTCLTDNNGVLAVSDIVIPTDYATSNTIYIATGDKDHWDNRSIGVLKSADGGSTWNATEISYSLSDGQMVNRLLLDPTNNQVIIAATSSGVYKTTDGGTNWGTQLSTVGFIDMEYKPDDFNTLYGSTQNGLIYFSNNGGTSWTQTFNDANAYRIELAVSANQPTWVYAVAVNSVNGLYGIYHSTNSGLSYSQVFDGTTLNLLGWNSDGADSGGQGWYDLCLAVSPSNANTLLVGGVNTWRSVNGGTSWSIVNHWWGDGVPAAHADKHNLSFRANGDLFECNDGGIYYSNNNGTNWTDKTNSMVISQMYKLGVSATVANEVITGLQDNGTKLLSGGSWSDVKGGDGMECLIDYSNVNIQYGTYVFGQISRTLNHWVSSTDIQPVAAGDGAWVTPYIIDPNDPQILYAGYADVWKTTNRGNSWSKISTMNTASNIRSMAIAPSNTQVLYAAAPSNIWKTTNGGTSWTEITGSLPVGSGSITYVTIHDNDANTLWVTLGGFNNTTVYQSTNGGTSWTNISAGLPAIPAYCIVQNAQSTTIDQLYVGTELGVYFKNGADNWVAYNTGLPNVLIGELEIYYATNPQESKLKAATYGRGLWETPVHYSALPMTYISGTTTQNNVSTVAPNQINQEIIGIQIVTNGNLTPLSATSFTLNTTGSTSPVTDITNAKLFYTGTNSSFSATSQFGTTSITPDGTFTITGNQILSEGINHFWLTYDIPLTAVFDNYLDAQCTSFSVTTAITPSVTNPAGSRLIGISYCEAGSNICDEYISNVSIGTINNPSTCSSGGYADYTAIATDIGQGSTLLITVTNGKSYVGDQCGIWVDWNNNGDFTDDEVI
ncbi:MAG: VPS10 domain-containing protein, partial [Bacteroidales bacterium]